MGDNNLLLYRILIKGDLDPGWSDWLNGFEIETVALTEGSLVTLMTGRITDQAALRGVLNKVWDLNLELIALVQIGCPVEKLLGFESSLAKSVGGSHGC